MLTVQTYFQYNDPLLITFRKGTPDDPYVPRADNLPVINGQITLLEIPSYIDKVMISGMTEVSQELLERKKNLRPNEFVVNYSNGIIQFHPSQEGKSFVCSYKGRGIILYPASRIYAMVQRSPDIVKTLQDIIDEALSKFNDLTDLKNELNIIINNALTAISNANIATDNANLARDNAIQATQKAQEATQEALDAAASTIMIYKDPVSTYEDLFIVYPNPENGWRVMVEQTGDIYRFDGINTHQWQLIDNYTGGSIPYVSETTHGLLKSDDYKNFIKRSIIFLMPSIFQTGHQNYIIQFPYDGEIIDAYGYCTKTGFLSPIELSVEKISSSDFDLGGSWESIFSNNIVIHENEYKGTKPTIIKKQVNKGDYFRVNVIQLDNNFKGVTVQLDIKIK